MLHGLRIFPSITARLILGLTLSTTVLWCGAAAYSSYISTKELNEAFDRALAEAAHHLFPLAVDDMHGHELTEMRGNRRFVKGQQEYLSYQIRNAAGRIVFRAHDAPPLPYDRTIAPGFSTIGKYRLFTERDAMTGLTITVAETTKGRMDAIGGAKRAMLLPLAALIPLNILAIWLVVRGAMRRVQKLGGDIAARSSHNLAPLDISGQPIELKPIAVAVARLVERLRAALDAERAFAANSAHELRTPIAGALAQTQRLIAELGDPKDRRRARDVETTLKRLSALAEKLMQLARVDAGVGVGAEEVDLIPVLDLVVEDWARRLGAPERVVYVKPEGARLVARMDMDAFAIAMRNLIDNAASHGLADGAIEVRVEPNGVIRVINGGPPIAPDVLAGLTRRFVRGETCSAGAGLGLAIVETIMDRTNGRLELLSPVPDRNNGFEARLTVNGSLHSGTIEPRQSKGATKL
jgi:two-component system, OmpR family, sensor kinase